MSIVNLPEVNLSRRGLLKAGVALGGGLMVGFGFMPSGVVAAESSPFQPSAFVSIDNTGRITLTMAKIEMGQGTYTSLPMLIAEELEVDLDQVQLRHAPPDARLYGGPRMDQFTGGSLTIRTLWQPMREVGAAARMILIDAAAQRWGVAAGECQARRGEVIHPASGRRLRFGRRCRAPASADRDHPQARQ